MSERDDKWGIWMFDFQSTHLDETGSESIESGNSNNKELAS